MIMLSCHIAICYCSNISLRRFYLHTGSMPPGLVIASTHSSVDNSTKAAQTRSTTITAMRIDDKLAIIPIPQLPLHPPMAMPTSTPTTSPHPLETRRNISHHTAIPTVNSITEKEKIKPHLLLPHHDATP
jgi:hypothetical protein